MQAPVELFFHKFLMDRRAPRSVPKPRQGRHETVAESTFICVNGGGPDVCIARFCSWAEGFTER